MTNLSDTNLDKLAKECSRLTFGTEDYWVHCGPEKFIEIVCDQLKYGSEVTSVDDDILRDLIAAKTKYRASRAAENFHDLRQSRHELIDIQNRLNNLIQHIEKVILGDE